VPVEASAGFVLWLWTRKGTPSRVGEIMARDWVKGIALVLLCVVLADAARGESIFPIRTGRVVDGAGLLSQQARESLTRELAGHERATSNQVVVVTVRSLNGLQIEDYALTLANKWGVGQTGRNNGVVLLVAPNERQVRIEVGTGLERRLTDAIAADIIERQMLPAFRAGHPEDGIEQGVESILVALEDGYQIVDRSQWSPQADRAGERPFPVQGIVFVGIFVVLVLMLRRGMDFGSGGGRNWRSDDNWGHRSSDRSSFGGSSSGGGGSFRGGGASGRW